MDFRNRLMNHWLQAFKCMSFCGVNIHLFYGEDVAMTPQGPTPPVNISHVVHV
jgi:hypothetical protein